MLGIGSPDSRASRYAPLPTSCSTRNGPSQFDDNLSSCFLALLTILQTRFSLWKDRGSSFELYFLVARSLVAMSWMCARSLLSTSRSRCVFIHASLGSCSKCVCQINGSLISIVSLRRCHKLGCLGPLWSRIVGYTCMPKVFP